MNSKLFSLKLHPDCAEILFSMTSENTTKKADLLYTIFEQHLFNFQDPNADRNTFVEGIVKEYLSHMRRLGLSVPMEWEEHISEELFFQVSTMLVKKIYGCLTIDEFTAKVTTQQKRRAKARYQTLERQVRRVSKGRKDSREKKAA
jgi:hypothetical protein